MARHADAYWTLPDNVGTWEQANTAVLMDLRDRMNFGRCPDFRGIPYTLKAILRELKRKPKADAFARHRMAIRRARARH